MTSLADDFDEVDFAPPPADAAAARAAYAAARARYEDLQRQFTIAIHDLHVAFYAVERARDDLERAV